jgi:hypothetical protein
VPDDSFIHYLAAGAAFAVNSTQLYNFVVQNSTQLYKEPKATRIVRLRNLLHEFQASQSGR